MLENLKSKKSKINENKDAILKNIHYGNNKVRKFDDKRLDKEIKIEEYRKKLKDNIQLLTSLMETVEKGNLGIDRLNGLSVNDRHVDILNNIIYKYGESNGYKVNVDNAVNSIDVMFKNSLEIKINMYKDLYNEPYKTINAYKRQENFDFEKINEIESLYVSRIWEHPYSMYPYSDQDMIDMNDRHLKEYANIIEGINVASSGEMSKEDIINLKERINKENLQTDMGYNYLSYKVADLSKYLAYVMERTQEKEVKHTM